MSLDVYVIGISALFGGVAGAVIAPYGDEKEADASAKAAYEKQKYDNENDQDLRATPDYSNPGHFFFTSQRTPQEAENAAYNSVKYMPKIKGSIIGTISGGILGVIADFSYNHMSKTANAAIVPDIYLLKSYFYDYGKKALDLIRI